MKQELEWWCVDCGGAHGAKAIKYVDDIGYGYYRELMSTCCAGCKSENGRWETLEGCFRCKKVLPEEELNLYDEGYICDACLEEREE